MITLHRDKLSFYLRKKTLNSRAIKYTLQDGILRNIQIKGNKLQVVQTWALDEAVSAIISSPDCETLLLTSNTVSVFITECV